MGADHSKLDIQTLEELKVETCLTANEIKIWQVISDRNSFHFIEQTVLEKMCKFDICFAKTILTKFFRKKT